MSDTKITTEPIIERMFSAGAHFGSTRSRRHPSVKGYVFGLKNRIEVLNLDKTSNLLAEAKTFASTIGKNARQILFVGTKSEAKTIIEEAAKRAGLPWVNVRWIGGTLTNFTQIKKRLAHLFDLEEKGAKGELSVYTKKERLLLSREVDKLSRHFDGIRTMKDLPAALFVIDSKHESTAVNEARHLRIPVISLSGSDCDITPIDHPIVGNDRAQSSIKFFVDEIVTAYLEGKASAQVAVPVSEPASLV